MEQIYGELIEKTPSTDETKELKLDRELRLENNGEILSSAVAFSESTF
jgi:hypothetical protein